MARNLRKFSSEAEYNAATLNYPSVAWVTDNDTIHYDKAEPQPVVTEKVALAFHAPTTNDDLVYYNAEAADANLITAIDVNGSPLDPIVPSSRGAAVAGDYLFEYTIEGTAIFDAFAGDLGIGNGSVVPSIEFLIPSFITDVDYLPHNEFTNLVIMATTPPNAEVDFSAFNVTGAIYVPDDYVRDYENSAWSESGTLTISPLSEYEGNLPVVVDNGGDESE